MRFTLELPGEPDGVPMARRFVRERLAGTPFENRLADYELILTELVTNATLHGVSPVTVSLQTFSETARFEVADASAGTPIGLARSSESMTGRGLMLVEALSDRWGVDRRATGKVVWAEAGVRERIVKAGALPIGRWLGGQLDEATVGDPVEPRHTIELGDVPTDLLLEAKAHVDSIIREFALASAGAASGQTAAVSADMRRLIETVGNRFAGERESIKRQAIAAASAGRERTWLVLTLPLSAADAGIEYLAALDEVDSYARAARLLTLETPPQHRAFRHWYISSLVGQLRAIARGEKPEPAVTFEQFLLDELQVVSTAHRAIDRAARLQEVTGSLAGAISIDEVAKVVVSQGVEALGASGGALLVPTENGRLEVLTHIHYGEALLDKLRRAGVGTQLPAAAALRSGQPVWIESPEQRDQKYPDLRVVEPEAASMCAVPLALAGRVLGVLRLSFDAPHLFDDGERAFVLAFAAQTVQAIERANLVSSEQEARRRSGFLADSTARVASSLDPTETMESLTDLIVPELADWSVVYLTDDVGRVVSATAKHRDAALTPTMRNRLRKQPLVPASAGEIAGVPLSGRRLRYGTASAQQEQDVAFLLGGEIEGVHASSVLAVPFVRRERILGFVVMARGQDPRYTDGDLQLATELADRAAVALDNATRFLREREAAVTLQRSLLPQVLPQVPGLALAWRYFPGATGTNVGGDWYDVIPLERDRVALIIGDVMGRGLRAAAMMGQLRATARAHVYAHLGAADVMARTDTELMRLEQEQIATALLAMLDPTTGTLTVASAGHLPPLLRTDAGLVTYLEVEPGPPLGTGAGGYVDCRVTLPDGATMLLYTDGLVEDRKLPIDEGLARLAAAAAASREPELLCDRALAALSRDSEHEDDTAMLAVHVSHSGSF